MRQHWQKGDKQTSLQSLATSAAALEPTKGMLWQTMAQASEEIPSAAWERCLAGLGVLVGGGGAIQKSFYAGHVICTVSAGHSTLRKGTLTQNLSAYLGGCTEKA